MDLTESESASLERTAARVENLSRFLRAQQPPSASASAQEWFAYLSEIKSILGNFSNDLRLVSCLLAKHYLSARLSLVPFDVAEKPQGASGLDIDERTTGGERVIGETKTTTTYKQHRFGAAQITALRKDFVKLISSEAGHQDMFVTDADTFDTLKSSFADELPGVAIICLTSGDEYMRSP